MLSDHIASLRLWLQIFLVKLDKQYNKITWREQIWLHFHRLSLKIIYSYKISNLISRIKHLKGSFGQFIYILHPDAINFFFFLD